MKISLKTAKFIYVLEYLYYNMTSIDSFIQYVPEKEILTPNDKSYLRNQEKKGKKVKIDARNLEHVDGGTAKDISNKGHVFTNLNPDLTQMFDTYSRIGIKVNYIPGQKFDDIA